MPAPPQHEPVSEAQLSRVRQLGDLLIAQMSALRDRDPLYWSDAQQTWIVTGHAEVAEGLKPGIPLTVRERMTRVFGYFPRAETGKIPNIMKYFPKFVINLDPPEQMRLRKLLMRAFSRNIAEAARPAARAIIDEALDAALARREVDFVDEVAMRVSGRLILKLMGLPDPYYARIRAWGMAVSRGLGAGGAQAEQVFETERAFEEMRDAFQTEIDGRRAAPNGDFISELVLAEENGDRLTDTEIIATCMLTVIAGHDTTANTIALIAACLAERTEALAHMRAHPEALDGIMMELMRHVAMSTAQFRVVSEDFEWRGRRLGKGQHVWLAIAAANRDPAVFPNPEALDFARPQTGNMTFAPGIHHCIGHFVARMQLGEFFGAFARRVAAVELLDERLDWDTPLTFRGLRQLNLRLSPHGAIH